jgi:tryptophan-rich sensory protein
MPIIMILYYLISIYIAAMLIWNFTREKKNKNDMILYLIVLIPLILRLFRVK